MFMAENDVWALAVMWKWTNMNKKINWFMKFASSQCTSSFNIFNFKKKRE